jgi:hypothetical protein
MNPQLSDQPTWFEPTAQIRALDDKSVRIKEANCEWVAKLAVDDAGPQDVNAGKCSVRAWETSIDNVKWTNAGRATPASLTHYHQEFLNEDAVKSLRENNENPEFIKLMLDLS